MSEIEKRQLNYDELTGDGGAESFERLIKGYSPFEIPPTSPNGPSDSAFNDIAYQNKIRDEPSRPGNVSDDTSVFSVYDARPINAVDFIIPLFCKNLNGVFSGNTFQVPPGLICVLKWFTLDQSGSGDVDTVTQTGSLSAAGKLFTILINKIAQPNYTRISLGTFSEKYPCYIFAPENSIVEFQLTN